MTLLIGFALLAATTVAWRASTSGAAKTRGSHSTVSSRLLTAAAPENCPPGSKPAGKGCIDRHPVFIERCPDYRKGLRWYRQRYNENREARGAGTEWPAGRKPLNCSDARQLAGVWRGKALVARRFTERWFEERWLHDYAVTAGNDAWERAVRETQKVFPGTDGWLLSCSASEGGWGRFVFNSQGSGAAGWLQYMPSTFTGFIWRARVDAANRGYLVPESAGSLYSPLGQALAGGWAITHGMRHHWAGSGCR